MKSRSIQQAITLDPALPALAWQAAQSAAPYVGFYVTPYGGDGGGEWDYWEADRADATASNVYYTPSEVGNLLIEKGFRHPVYIRLN